MPSIDRSTIRAAARETLGHRTLLPGQAEAVAAITSGRDTLALLPTGGGKSAIYQLAGVMIDGPSVVVSPLIALQADQLAAMEALELGAAVVNSARRASERVEALAAFGRGEIEFLLLGPETLSDEEVRNAVAQGHPSLLVVDEAHCVAEWGRDFRPEYRHIGAMADALGRPPILALTATASPLIRAEIVSRLGLRDPAVIARGFDRPNIDLTVETHTDERSKLCALTTAVVEAPKPGIVYVATRDASETVAEALESQGIRAAPYHAGLAASRRDDVQTRFMADELDVIVATIAFGMGIDKPNVRFVFHLDAPESLDAYHQEVGRAGRDGDPAEARLFYRPEDLGLRRFQAAPAKIDEPDVRAVIRALRRASEPLAVADLARKAGRSRRKTDAVVARLEELEAVEVAAGGEVTIRDDDGAGHARASDAVASAVVAQERRRIVERSRVEMVRAYAEAPGCRRAVLLGYFGEAFDPPCFHCDRCRALAAAAEDAATTAADDGDGGTHARDGADEANPSAAFAVGDRVRHASFGVGTVTGLEPDRVVIAFEDAGYRTISADAVDEGLLLGESA